MRRKIKKPKHRRPKDTQPTAFWLQLQDEQEEVILLKRYENTSLIKARLIAFGHCDKENTMYFPKAHTALVYRGSCDPENPSPDDVWEDYTCEQGMKGFAPVPTLQLKVTTL